MAENKKKYEPSEGVLAAEEAARQQSETRPGAYRSAWQSQLDAAMERILNRQPFHYDLNGDALYRQYRDQAVRGGQMAMMDTVGQAAALTGGYGNSYALSAGQQAYQNQLQGLNDRIPELYALALEQYDRLGKADRQAYDLLLAREDSDYGRYQDAADAWQREQDRLWARYTDALGRDYDAWRDSVEDEHWQARFDEDNRRYEQEWAEAHPPQQEAPQSTWSGGSGSGGSSGGSYDYNRALRESIALMNRGGSYREIQAYLNSALSQGLIREEDIETINRRVTDARDSRH